MMYSANRYIKQTRHRCMLKNQNLPLVDKHMFYLVLFFFLFLLFNSIFFLYFFSIYKKYHLNMSKFMQGLY